MERPDAYTETELVAILKVRQGGLTQTDYAIEIGISPQLLSQIYAGQRSVGTERVLKYLAPKGSKFVHKDTWVLVQRGG